MFKWLFTKEHLEKREKAKKLNEKLADSAPKGGFNWSRGSRSISITNDSFIVNGIKLKPGTPEYIKAREAFDKDMEKLGREMEDLSKNIGSMFKDV